MLREKRTPSSSSPAGHSVLEAAALVDVRCYEDGVECQMEESGRHDGGGGGAAVVWTLVERDQFIAAIRYENYLKKIKAITNLLKIHKIKIRKYKIIKKKRAKEIKI